MEVCFWLSPTAESESHSEARRQRRTIKNIKRNVKMHFCNRDTSYQTQTPLNLDPCRDCVEGQTVQLDE